MKPQIIIEMCKPVVIARLACTVCGSEAEASCNCGAPYMPAGQRAAQAVAAHPEKSDRAIAAETGISLSTVNRVRKNSPVANGTPEKRMGRDGKSYPATKPTSKQEDIMPTAEEAEESYQATVYDQACLLLGEMAGETRQKFFAYLEKKYHVKVS